MKCILAVALMLASTTASASEKDLDSKLALIKEVFDLQPRGCVAERPDAETLSDQAKLGKLFFESKALSGNRDTSCSTCHLEEHALADGLPLAVGVGGHGEGADRMRDGRGVIVARNAFTLFGRGLPEFQAFFWDGKIQVEENRVIKPFGDQDLGFDSGLAAAAILPILERDEFIGVTSHLRPNDIEYKAAHLYYAPRYAATEGALRERLQTPSHAEDIALHEAAAAVGYRLESLSLSDIGNAIAAFVTERFPCERTRWDDYLEGDTGALTRSEKEGMALFYGQGRCISCHAGRVGSDFQYHSLGVPQGAMGPHSRGRDKGRAGATFRAEDLFRFRTPPLLSVAKTAPYGHNGIFESLEAVVRHHFDPVAIYRSDNALYEMEKNVISRTMDTRSPLLPAIEVRDGAELEALLAFIRLH